MDVIRDFSALQHRKFHGIPNFGNHACGLGKFLKRQRIHIGCPKETHGERAYLYKCVQAQKRAGENHIQVRALNKELHPSEHVLTLLNLIEEEQGIPWNQRGSSKHRESEHQVICIGRTG